MIEEVFQQLSFQCGSIMSSRMESSASGSREEKKELRIHVYNDGNPIPEKDLEKLWIKFL